MIKRRTRYKETAEDKAQKQYETMRMLKSILAVTLIVAAFMLFFNPNFSLGPLDFLRTGFFKTEIVLSGEKYTPDGLVSVINNNDKKAVKLFLRSGFNLNALDSNGISPLCRAAQNGNLEIVNILLKGNISLINENSNGLTPIFCAIDGNNTQILDRMMKEGLNKSSRNQAVNGISPLHYAASTGKEEMVEYLVKDGADVMIRDLYGKTPLHYAVLQNNIVVLHILLNAGAYPLSEDNEGNSPLSIAEENDFSKYVKLLKQHLGQ